MAEPEQNRGEHSENEPNASSYTPASFEKRTAAWMGIAYVLVLLFVINFTIYTGGRELPGTFPLFLLPVSIAMAVVIVHRLKTRAPLPGGTAGAVLVLAACAAGVLLGLVMGVPPLIAAFGG